MPQTIISVVLEVQPASADILSALIDQLREAEEAPPPGYSEEYGRLKESMPTLHFMSMTIFTDNQYDPIFVLEANFDGPAGPFWAALEALLGNELRAILRCCKRPADNTRDLYDVVTSPGARNPIAPYMEAKTLAPAAFHVGNRGLDRGRILREGDLFQAVRIEIAANDKAYRLDGPQKLHQALRATLLPRFPWLNDPAPARIGVLERLGDWLRLFLLLCVVFLLLSVVGLAIAPMMSWWRYLVVMLVATVVIAVPLYLLREPLKGQSSASTSRGLVSSARSTWGSLENKIFLIVVSGVFSALYCGLVTILAAVVVSVLTGSHFVDALQISFRAVALGLLSVPFSAMVILLWLRRLELADSFQDAPPVNDELLREMARREDQVVQNHMGSIVLVKPGLLRAVLIRAGLRAVGLAVRVIATDGYLGSMRTIHFAHWALVNNGSRLMFFSNFDGSWESYLDDFIEKAHSGLTLAWCNGVGFPPARFLIFDGASHGRRFKAWARHSMALSQFWFSAYKNYSVDQIERQARVATGLQHKTLGSKEAGKWCEDL
jgi:hypothetical protein